MFLLDTNPSEITRMVEVLKNSKIAGYDGLSAAIIEAMVSDIIIQLTIIINTSLASGQFPNSIKLTNHSYSQGR